MTGTEKIVIFRIAIILKQPPLIRINRHQVSISKYLVFYILMLILLKPLYPKIIDALRYHKTVGVVDAFTFTEYDGYRGKRTRYYPVVKFTVNADTFTCYGSSLQHDGLYVHDSIRVMYDPGNPSKAYVYTFLGFWAPRLTYIIPLSVILLLTFFGLTNIPRYFSIKF